MWEYSRTWWLEELSQTYSMWWFKSLISFLSLVMIWWCISPVIQVFFEAYQSTNMSFTCILYFFYKQWGVLDLPMTDSFLWSEPSMLVIISSVSLSLHFAEPCRLVTIKAISPMRQRLVKQDSFIPIVNVIWWVPGKGGEKNSFLPGFKFIIGSRLTLCYHRLPCWQYRTS